MKAYPLKRHGKPSVLRLSELPEPGAPDPHEILVRNLALGLNYAEILSRKGQYSWAPKKPYIPGMECFGEVIAVGDAVKEHRVGDRVMTGMQYGSYAELVKVPEFMAFSAFPGYSEAENAATLVNYMTAWIALFEQAQVRPGETVLIEAAAGGVGTAAVQLCKAQGCRVIGLAGNAQKIALLKELGADLAINYREGPFAEEVRRQDLRPDVVLELVGGDVFRQSYGLLKPFGRMAVAGFAAIPLVRWNPLTWIKTLRMAPKAKLMDMAQRSIGMYATHIGYLIDQPELVRATFSRAAEFMQAHGIKPVVGKEFAFGQIPEAHAFIEGRGSYGKVVVRL
ncbi:MAG: zinc-binding dehydrogenase [Bacteroidota bacterium]